MRGIMKNIKHESFLKKYSEKRYYLLGASFIFAALTAIFYLLTPYNILKVMNHIFTIKLNGTSLDKNYILLKSALSIIFLFLSILSYLLALICSHLTAFRLENNIRKLTFKNLLNKPLGFFDNRDSGEIRKIIDENASLTHSFVAHTLPDLFVNLILPFSLIIMMLFIDWKLGLLTLVVPISSLLFLLLVMGIISKKNGNSLKKYMDSLEDMAKNGVEYVRGISVVKMYQNSNNFLSNFKRSILSYSKWVLNYTLSFRKYMVIFSVSVNLSFAVLITYFFLNRNIGIGYDTQLANFIFYILVSMIIPVRIMKIAHLYESSNILKSCAMKIEEISSEKDCLKFGDINVMNNYDIEFKNVTFKYTTDGHNVLKNISFKAKNGTITGIVGFSGSGKSTIAKLIPRFYDINDGKVTIGGINIKDYSQKCLNKNISFVFQSNKLFNGTIKENLLFAKPDATYEELITALKSANALSIIEKLTDGINTKVGPEGIYLSGGEQQRISLARAILKDSPIIILDEATAFADPENEKEIQQALSNLITNKTVFMIAHRLATIKNVDNIIVVNDGEIINQGNHEQLIKESQIYKQMWDQYNKSLSWKLRGIENV